MSGVAVEGLWSAELRGTKARLRPLFLQAGTAASAAAFLDGLLGPERRKTGWMRGEAAGDKGPWRQQAVLGRASWEADALRDVVREYALESLAEPDATLVIDETGFLKQGMHRAIAAEVPFTWVAADTVYGGGEVEMALRRAGKGYVLGVTSAAQFTSWGKWPDVAGTAGEIAEALGADRWLHPSAGEGTKGPRLYDWAYLELADLDPEMVGAPPGLGIWTRGLRIRRRPADGELAFFTTWCPEGTPMDTLVRVEGRRRAIEDAFETAKTELGLDHNETRSWHGWHRHVSLVMLAFALLAVVRHKADALAPPPKTARKDPRPWFAGRCRRSVVLPTA